MSGTRYSNRRVPGSQANGVNAPEPASIQGSAAHGGPSRPETVRMWSLSSIERSTTALRANMTTHTCCASRGADPQPMDVYRSPSTTRRWPGLASQARSTASRSGPAPRISPTSNAVLPDRKERSSGRLPSAGLVWLRTPAAASSAAYARAISESRALACSAGAAGRRRAFAQASGDSSAESHTIGRSSSTAQTALCTGLTLRL
jgi:hypothetical protein